MASTRRFQTHLASWLTLLLVILSVIGQARAQSSQFIYQGRLTEGSLSANGSYDFQFRLFDASAGGVQISATQSLTNISVSSGVFTVILDFGTAAFPGANRWLEIGVRSAGVGSFTILSPRQLMVSTPYSVKSLSATMANTADSLSAACVGCVGDAQIASISGGKVTGAIPLTGVPAGSGNYIQNTNSQQAANFNINGNGSIGGALSVAGAGGIRWANSLLSAGPEGGSIELGSTGATAGTGTPYIDFHFAGLTQDYNTRLVNAEDNVLTVHSALGAGSPETSVLRIGTARTTQSGETRRIAFGDDNAACGGPCVYIAEENVDDRLIFNARDKFVFKGSGGSTTPDVIPASNGDPKLGDSNHRWNSVWAVNNVIQTSDARLKKSVTNLDYGLSQVMQLRPVSFQWNNSKDDRTRLGLIAQEVEKVIPEAIERDKDPDTALGMNYTSLVPVLIKAVQEQQARLERKEAEIKSLNARLAALEQIMRQLKEQADK
jgi:hypothetical protein